MVIFESEATGAMRRAKIKTRRRRSGNKSAKNNKINAAANNNESAVYFRPNKEKEQKQSRPKIIINGAMKNKTNSGPN